MGNQYVLVRGAGQAQTQGLGETAGTPVQRALCTPGEAAGLWRSQGLPRGLLGRRKAGHTVLAAPGVAACCPYRRHQVTISDPGLRH